MSKNRYDVYISNTFNLANTLSIKSQASAEMINTNIKLIYGDDTVDDYDKTSWKYYQNICGEYHFSDEMIYITSIDTTQKIPFTKESFQTHKGTLVAYQYGTRYYKELVDIHPDKKQLILGVLYPADMDTAINAKDGSILSYNPAYLEANEYSLIEDIENWIYRFKARWDVKSFAISDNLYSTAHLGVLYLQLVPLILSLRNKRCKTNEAHSFHVNTYLESHGYLDTYINYLTLEQRLFLYRNISYIERNPGRRKTLSYLIENLLTKRKLPISEYTMKHDDSMMPVELLPQAKFRKKPLNPEYNTRSGYYRSYNEIMDKEQLLANGNFDDIKEHGASNYKKLQHSLSSVVATKMLESAILDYTDAVVYPLQETLFNHWMYFSNKGTYNAFITVTDPRTGAGKVITVKDGFIYAMYCLAKAIGSDLDKVPDNIAVRVQRDPKPTAVDIYKVASSQYVDSSVAQEIVDIAYTTVTNIYSVDSFVKHCQGIAAADEKFVRLIAYEENHIARAMIENMTAQMYCEKVVSFADKGMDYFEWLNSKALPMTDFTKIEYYSLYNDIVRSCTGYGAGDSSYMKNLQNAMLKILKQLSSYSIQIISEINTSKIIVAQWASTRIGAGNTKCNAIVNFPFCTTEILDVVSRPVVQIEYDCNYPSITTDIKFIQKVKLHYELTVKAKFADPISIKLVKDGGLIGYDLSVTIPGEDPLLIKKYGAAGYSFYESMTDVQKNKIKDNYAGTQQI